MTSRSASSVAAGSRVTATPGVVKTVCIDVCATREVGHGRRLSRRSCGLRIERACPRRTDHDPTHDARSCTLRRCSLLARARRLRAARRASASGADDRKPSLSLRATPPVGFSPLRVRVVVDVRGGADDYAGLLLSAPSNGTGATARCRRSSEDCDPYEAGKSAIQRRFSAEHVYRQSGTYPGLLPPQAEGQDHRASSSANVQVRAGMRDEFDRLSVAVDAVMAELQAACASGSASELLRSRRVARVRDPGALRRRRAPPASRHRRRGDASAAAPARTARRPRHAGGSRRRCATSRTAAAAPPSAIVLRQAARADAGPALAVRVQPRQLRTAAAREPGAVRLRAGAGDRDRAPARRGAAPARPGAAPIATDRPAT